MLIYLTNIKTNNFIIQYNFIVKIFVKKIILMLNKYILAHHNGRRCRTT